MARGWNPFEPTPDFSPHVMHPAPQERVPLPEVGSEIPFPFDITTITDDLPEDFERPKIVNYYFERTRLLEGPPDPEVFMDDLHIEFRSEEDLYHWTIRCTVATPKGLSKYLEDGAFDSMSGDNVIIIKRYDLATALKAVLEDCFTHSAYYEQKRREAQELETTRQNEEG